MYMLIAEASGTTSADYSTAGNPVPENLSGPSEELELTPLAPDGSVCGAPERLDRTNWAQRINAIESTSAPRWLWNHTNQWYPGLLRVGITVARCYDLSLCRAILRGTTPEIYDEQPRQQQESLFAEPSTPTTVSSIELIAELSDQLRKLHESEHPKRLGLLLAAESAGALVAAEMQYYGLPWREDLHQALLESVLGPKPTTGKRPQVMENLLEQLYQSLHCPPFNPDSPHELIRVLRRAGIEVKSTRSWELEKLDHPAIPILLAYKKLSRLLSANGWNWLEHWVHQGRFRPEYIVGGVVSGRWASRGGGALQIPKQVRSAVHASPGWKLVVADAAQLEPRVLAALAQDEGLARAGRGRDLYTGIADAGFGGDRSKAKIALLGAIYGSTTGESGRLMPQLTRLYPRAVGFVERAARAGERGELVSTFLGRRCPPPGEGWEGTLRSTTAAEERQAEAIARSRGRFTRNFVVQGSAAEWALCWLAQLRRCLANRRDLGAELVFFLHDEVIVHCPEASANTVSDLIQESALSAKELIYGDAPVDFPVNIAVVDHYDQAK